MDISTFMQIGSKNKITLRETKDYLNRIELQTDLSTVVFFLILSATIITVLLLYFVKYKRDKQEQGNNGRV